MTKRQRADLRARLHAKELLVAPGVFDGISARIADQMDFEALYMTGYGTVASHLGLPDAGIATYSDMVGRVEVIAGGTTTPLIADGDTGYGGLLNVQYTVRGYEAAGAVAIQLEDQEFPKKCGHMLGRRVVPIEDMVDKVKVAVASRESRDFLIIARTDARTTLGLDRGIAPRGRLRQGRRRHSVCRESGKRRGDADHRPDFRSAAGRQHGRRRTHADP